MEITAASSALAAMAQPTRLSAFRLLVAHEPYGLAAGEIARSLGVPANTLSTHLAVLTHEGLITAERQSRSIVYRAQIARLRDLMLFLAKDCCGGRDELCTPLIHELACC
jgi:ArsR family transcriptional regulator, arsenate/arsenite/antimonite-responsive transcriptional repressor